MIDRKKCIVIVPANYGVEPECEQSLVQLERRGYHVSRVRGFANIDQCRNEAATEALKRGFDEVFWIDSDVAFHPDSVDTLRSHNLPIVSGIYPKKGQRSLASRLLDETKEVQFGVGGGLIEVLHAATGFLLTRREVYERIREHCKLPVCNEQWGKPAIPYFLPMVIETDRGPWYLGDDFSFCHRARQAGFKIFADTSIRLGHIGRYAFSWEDAGGSNQRFGSYKFHVEDANG